MVMLMLTASGLLLHVAGAGGAGNAIWAVAGGCGAGYALWAMADALRHGRVGVNVPARATMTAAASSRNRKADMAASNVGLASWSRREACRNW
jgi:hypothetical protein